MSRILFVVPPLTGHINPALSVAAELGQLGHDVRWAVHQAIVGTLFPEKTHIIPLPINPDFMRNFVEHSHHVRGLASVRFFYEDLCLPLTRLSLAPLERIVQDFQPDLIVCDHQMLAGALVARKMQIPWLTLATTSASVLRLSGANVMYDWIVEKMLELQKAYGMPDTIERPDFSPHGVIVFSSRELVGSEHEYFPANYHFVGPAFSNRPQSIEFPWDSLDPALPKILVSLGTVSRDRGLRFYEVLMEAMAEIPVQVVMVGPEILREKAPDNFIIQPRVPQLALLPYMTAVICHGGHNTVCESLYYGLPLIVAPIRDDQPIVAQQVINAGAGLIMRYGKVSVAVARETVQRLLDEPQFRIRAQALAESFKRLGGAKQAAGIAENFLADVPVH